MADDIPIRIHGYKLGKTVGVGAFGKVKHAVHEKTGVEVAIKILNRRKIHTQDMEEKVRREIANLRRCRHPHVIALYEVISCPTDIFVVMEYVPNGELFEHIVQKGRLGASEAREVFQQILAGVAYFHARGIVHRDLKPENLLLDSDYNIKIADFGLSNVMMDGYFLRTSCGSPNYAAPEVISGELYAGPEVDVWSLGVILFALLCGSLPFDDENIPNLFKKIRSGRFKTPGLLGKEATDLVKRILKVPPMERLTLDQIRNHEWVLQDLPKYLAHEFLRTEQEFDREIAAKVKDMGYPDCTTVADVQAAVDSDEASPVQVAYNLLLDVKRRAQRSEDLAAARAKRMARSESGGSLLSSVEESAGLAPLSFGRRDATGVVMSRSLSSMSMFGSGTLSVGPGAGAGPRTPTTDDTVMTRKRPKRRRWRRWYLGIQSKKAPSKVMSEVFRALSEGGFEWKQRGPYRIRCRCLDESTGKYIKIGLQLYRVQRGIYLLDLQKISGDGFTFMNLCSQIIMELKVPSSSLTVTKVVPGDTGLVGHAVRSIRSESVGSGHSLSPTMYPSTPPSAPLPMPIKGRGPRAPQPPL